MKFILNQSSCDYQIFIRKKFARKSNMITNDHKTKSIRTPPKIDNFYDKGKQISKLKFITDLSLKPFETFIILAKRFLLTR